MSKCVTPTEWRWKKLSETSFLLLIILLLTTAGALRAAQIESFAPQGYAKDVRQVRATFTDAMVPLSAPKEMKNPFSVKCVPAVKGEGRWSDSKNWVYSFEKDPPSGVRCAFTPIENLKTLKGEPVETVESYELNTGGPAVENIVPEASSEYYEAHVDEDQIFMLKFDGEIDPTSLAKNVHFVIDGMPGKVEARVLSAAEAQPILKTRHRGDRGYTLIQAKQNFPFNTRVNLVVEKGVMSKSGVASESEQSFLYRSRLPFTATFTCERENAESDCIPFADFSVSFSSALDAKLAQKVTLTGPDGVARSPVPRSNDTDSVTSIQFKGPFAEKTVYEITVPKLVDDAGRELSNSAKFPLRIRTAGYPPLAKFGARFGIVELGSPILPVTLRALGPTISGRILKVGEENISSESLSDSPTPAGFPTQRIEQLEFPKGIGGRVQYWIDRAEGSQREYSIFDVKEKTGRRVFETEPFELPKPNGGKAFEVVGIPFKEPGFYVLELESPQLGQALLGTARSLYVPTAVLVTNLSVHYKRGQESSLIWVTTLDNAQPVDGAEIEISDAKGNVLARAKTGKDGTARTQENLLPLSEEEGRQGTLVVTARKGDDFSFVRSNWDNGIEPWRFNLSTSSGEYGLVQARSVLDRTLLRAGDTLHLKHFIRRRVGAGFSQLPKNVLPEKMVIRHSASEQRYEQILNWNADGSAESEWKVPADTKLGYYSVSLLLASGKQVAGESEFFSGSFRVEEFRVPLMQGRVKFQEGPMIHPSQVNADVFVKYLSGGGASGLTGKLRYHVENWSSVGVSGFDEFVFDGERLKEGVKKRNEDSADEPSTEDKWKSQTFTLDSTGSARVSLSKIRKITQPSTLATELEYRDSNGDIQTVGTRAPLWSADRRIGVRLGEWQLRQVDPIKVSAAVVDLKGKPIAGAPVTFEVFQSKVYSHRKRLVGGFYGYEHVREVKKLGKFCEGTTDATGVMACEAKVPEAGEVYFQATTRDVHGNEAVANRQGFVYGKSESWFAADDNDRIDLIPEKKRYEPGENARLQIRMPFRKAKVLLTVEREGVMESWVRDVSGKDPWVEIPMRGNYAPNVFVSAMVVRGRVGDIQPTAMVDLGRPAFKLGLAQINVGWKTHELKVAVSADKTEYRVREKAQVKIKVVTADGTKLPAGAEVALAAVDEGLLELYRNETWDLLGDMMGLRPLRVTTMTGQMHVVGKRHFGLKAQPPGGGGGAGSTRELFDTLLTWIGRVKLDANGEGNAEVPLNDSLTSFRIVAIASAGADRFGTGETSIRSTQELMLMSGLPLMMRQGDKFLARVTVRNTQNDPMSVTLSLKAAALEYESTPQTVELPAGQSKIVSWPISIARDVSSVAYEIEAEAHGGQRDRLKVNQKIVAAVPVRTYQATIEPVSVGVDIPVQQPRGALPGKGGIDVKFVPKLTAGMNSLRDWWMAYPYSCLEQKVSRAIALGDEKALQKINAELSTYFDSDGLLKYFPDMEQGSEVLTSYVMAVSNEANWAVDENSRERMKRALTLFVQGKLIRGTGLRTADLALRKVAAIEALSRWGMLENELAGYLPEDFKLWPTSSLLDLYNIFRRNDWIAERERKLAEVENLLRARLILSGRALGFSTEADDRLFWLMISPDGNAARLLSAVLDQPSWQSDLPRLVKGLIARQTRGAWDITTSNVWGKLALDKFSKKFESEPASGSVWVSLGGEKQVQVWKTEPQGKTLRFAWPKKQASVRIENPGGGKPWIEVQTTAAIPLKKPLSSGYRLRKKAIAVEKKNPAFWSEGDLVRYVIDIDAEADMSWVVVNDPIPAGSVILGGVVGRAEDPSNAKETTNYPSYEERSFESYRAYYDYLPRGHLTVSYTVRLGNSGAFALPPTRVEAMYNPEAFGEFPNATMTVK